MQKAASALLGLLLFLACVGCGQSRAHETTQPMLITSLDSVRDAEKWMDNSQQVTDVNCLVATNHDFVCRFSDSGGMTSVVCLERGPSEPSKTELEGFGYRYQSDYPGTFSRNWCSE